jgi:hypothetical protein
VTHLLRAEIALYGGAPDDLLGNFALGPDGGRDTSTRRNVPISSPGDALIPEGETVWQCKAEQQSPDVREFAEELSKPRPTSCLNAGGHYIFTAQKPAHDEDDVEALLKGVALSNGFDDARVRFLAQHRLAEFARRHPSLALLEFFPVRPEGLEPFATWERDHQEIPFEPQAHGVEFRALQSAIRPGRFHIAVTGPTGVGKSRLVLEAVRAARLESFIAYAPEPGDQVNRFVEHLRVHNVSCVLIVDECDESNAAVLREKLLVTHAGLITIGADRDGTANRPPSGDALIRLRPLPRPVIAKVLESNRGLDPEAIAWVAERTGGYIKLAKLVADELAKDSTVTGNIAQVSAITTVEHALKRMLGDDAQRLELLQLMACFANVEHVAREGVSEVRTLASKLGISLLSVERLCDAAKRGQVLADTGGYFYVTPDLLAQWLLQRFLTVHSASFVEWLPTLPERLRQAHTRQLERLRGSEDGKNWAARLLRPSGPFGDLLALRQTWADQALLALSSAAKEAAVDYVATWAGQASDAIARVCENATLRHVLFRLMRSRTGFERLFTFLVDVFEAAGAPESGEISDLLRGMLVATSVTSTLAPYSVVLDRVQDELTRRPPSVRRRLLEMLGTGLAAPTGEAYVEYDHDPDDQGRDATPHEQQLRAVQLILGALADVDNQVQVSAASFLIQYARQLVALHLHEEFFAGVERALDLTGKVGTLAEELDMILAYEQPTPEVRSRVVQMRNDLARDLRTRVRLVVEGWSIVDPEQDQRDVVRPDPASVALELADADEEGLPELVGLVFEDSARNPGELLDAAAKLQRSTRFWPHVLEKGRASHKPWPVAIFLARAREAGHALMPGALELLVSSDPFDREVAANTLTMSSCSENEIAALVEALRVHSVDPNWTRACAMGRWNEKQTPKAVATLIEGLVACGTGAWVAVLLSHRALESKQPLDTQLVIQVLAASAASVQGQALWVWQRVGFTMAKRDPAALFEALLAAIRGAGVGHADDELEQVLAACCASMPELAQRLLGLWDVQPYFVARRLGSTVTSHVSGADLIEWAGEDRARQSALGRMVPATNVPLTVQLVEAFGENSPFSSAIEAEASSGSWSGNLSGFYAARGEEWKRHAESATTPRFRRLAERISRRHLAAADHARHAEADEEAIER